MSRNKSRTALLAAVALITGLLSAGASVQAAEPLVVQVGGFLQESGAPADGMRFYAPALKVAAGDTVAFDIQGFHTATLLPANTDVQSWAASNAGGVGKPYSFFGPDADDNEESGGSSEEPALKANNAALLPSSFECGPASTPCAYDGSSVVNSGVSFSGDPWSVQIDAAVGDVVWVVCLVHPHMRLKITVVATDAEATKQSEIDAAAAAMKSADSDWAAATHERLLKKRTSHVDANGKRVWDVYVGFDNHFVSLLGMYPRRLVVKRGQSVRFRFDNLVYEDHTATFPANKARVEASRSFVPSCDTNGDEAAGGDVPPMIEGPPFCSDPSQLEFDIQPRFAYERGDGIFRGGDFESSGVRGPGAPSWDLKFAKRSGDKPFKYICMIHPFMLGVVKVK